ncbi:YcaO-like family protein [Streptomyces sp. NPDC002659]|uniref:YcaO-like family protein n=1 Tax=Streptomyces sp. NPDC002659 TaxID=3364656 RepID=UPI0036B13AA6
MIGTTAAHEAPGAKWVMAGTHRVCAPEVTLARVRPVFARAGITRVADLTGLDEIGIPVWQAVRPNARTLSVSQGKGATAALAEASAVMEAIEVWHAEQVRLPAVRLSVAEMAPQLPYAVRDLPLRTRSVLSGAARLEWVAATAWGQSDQTWVPQLCVGLDSTGLTSLVPPLFFTSSNGLASGNTAEEAISHGLCEVLERDALARAGTSWRGRRLDLAGVDGSCAALLERFTAAQVSVAVRDIGDLAGAACFEAVIWSRSLPFCFTGSGCHLDAQVALSRALTEAAQSRLTLIAGSRDDIPASVYSKMASRRHVRDPLEQLPTPAVKWRQVAWSRATASHPGDIDVLAGVVRRCTGRMPLVVDLTRPEVGIPVVRVLAPGLDMPRSH